MQRNLVQAKAQRRLLLVVRILAKLLQRGKHQLIASAGQQLAQRLQARDDAAMAEIYQLYGRRLFSVILRSVANGATAEDLLQDSLFRIWNRVHTFDAQRGSFESWMITVARNRTVDHIRRARKTRSELSLSAKDFDAAADRFALASTEGKRILGRWELKRALDSLTKIQWRVLNLAYVEGLSQSEIAVQLESRLAP